MARSLSDEELQLRKRARRRLIGAIALVVAVAVVLPMVLDREPRPVGQDVDIKIPAPDSSTFTSKVAPLSPSPVPQLKPAPQLQTTPATAGKPAETAAAPKPATAADEAGKEKAPPAEKPPAAKPAAPATQPAPAVKPPTKTVASKESAGKTKAPNGQFVVQVAALSDAAKAKQMRQQISSAGIKSYTQVVKTVKGDVTRVRAGPFATREAAEKAQKQLKAVGLDGKVVPK